MFRRIVTRILSIANMPLFGTRAIPRDATVDPTLFSEEEYPVLCFKCGYLLRGLPDGNCPECGKPFERGRLLVQQYVHDWSGRAWRQSKAGMWCTRLFVFGFVIYVATLVGFFVFANPRFRNVATPPTLASINQDMSIARALITFFFLGPALHLVAGALALVAYPRGARKRRRAVINAIPRTQRG